MLTKKRIEKLYEEYKRIIDLEVTEFGCAPTEVRHLIGRLGEFYCAIKVNGTLSSTPNQHGFDVISNYNKKISVKTTAQKNCFVNISKNSLEKDYDLMLIQYSEGELRIIYYGPIEAAIRNSRENINPPRYNFSLSKAKKLQVNKGYTFQSEIK